VLEASHRKMKPLAVFLAPRADEGLALLEENGVAGFRTPETCADAIHAYLAWCAPAVREAVRPGELAKAALLARCFRQQRLNERDSCALFAALGIPVAKSAVLSVDETGDAGVEGKAAVKILSADIPHKTEAGLVRLGVPAADVRKEAEALMTRARAAYAQARIDGVMVQQMEEGLTEVIIGYRLDPEVGPVVLLGAGGITAGLGGGHCVRCAPVSLVTAERMIGEVAELAVIRGYRNLPRGDCSALARAIRQLSLLAALDARVVSEAEINPLIVKREGEGVVAVDGLVVFA
jgi:acyl-CoA synthetase (NDP forming)